MRRTRPNRLTFALIVSEAVAVAITNWAKSDWGVYIEEPSPTRKEWDHFTVEWQIFESVAVGVLAGTVTLSAWAYGRVFWTLLSRP